MLVTRDEAVPGHQRPSKNQKAPHRVIRREVSEGTTSTGRETRRAAQRAEREAEPCTQPLFLPPSLSHPCLRGWSPWDSSGQRHLELHPAGSASSSAEAGNPRLGHPPTGSPERTWVFLFPQQGWIHIASPHLGFSPHGFISLLCCHETLSYRTKGFPNHQLMPAASQFFRVRSALCCQRAASHSPSAFVSDQGLAPHNPELMDLRE